MHVPFFKIVLSKFIFLINQNEIYQPKKDIAKERHSLSKFVVESDCFFLSKSSKHMRTRRVSKIYECVRETLLAGRIGETDQENEKYQPKKDIANYE